MEFPAFSTEEKTADNQLEGEDWLHCSSFVLPEKGLDNESSKKHKKSHRKRKRVPALKEDNERYHIDTTPIPQVKCARTVPTPSASTSITLEQTSGVQRSPKSKTKRRKKKKNQTAKNRYFSEDLQLESGYNKIDPEEYFRKTRELNVLLREHTHDVDSWCEYIQLQDKGEGAKSGIASKKLSIVDKALEHNPSSDILLTIKLELMEETMPYDKVVSEAKILASKHVSSKIGWRWLISSTQFNLTRLTAPGLINHFGAMLEDATKRGGQPKFILDVLLEVGMFLRHAGLWELLWTLVEQYLEICFTVIGSEAFKTAVALPREEIDRIEDGIMTSGLPLHALWVRTEHLRSCVHFVPTLEDAGDHQRLILPEDVAPLLYPISTDLSARLSGIALTLLKVPPLPCSEAFMSFLGLKSISWHLESSEVLLTAMLPPGVTRVDDVYLNELKELLVPPQYINNKLGSDCFFNAVNKMFHLIADHSSQDKINFLVWLIRWYQFCVKTKSLSGPIAKSLLADAKNILKKHRTDLPIYTEYAILEEQAGNVTLSIKVLETAINLQEPALLASQRDQRCIFAAYRAYVEVLLRNQLPDYKDRLFKLFIAMAFGEKLEKVCEVKPDLISKALERFDHVSAELFTNCDTDDPSMDDIMIGPANLHWLACHAWFYFIQRGKLPDFLQLDENLLAKSPTLSEGLIQLKIDVLGLMKTTGCSSFDNKGFADLVVNACVRYPNNTSFLHTLSSLRFDGVRWGKISSSLVQSGSQIAVMYFALLSKNRLFSEDVQQSGAITKMYSILKKCSESEHLKRCPMLWRLVLQYVSSTHDEGVVEKEYHKAIENCPWVKILYYEAAIHLPKLLADIQDLLTEKELRIHVTPEELEILRESAPPEDTVAEVEDVINTEKDKTRGSEDVRRSATPDDEDSSSDEDSTDNDNQTPNRALQASRYIPEHAQSQGLVRTSSSDDSSDDGSSHSAEHGQLGDSHKWQDDEVSEPCRSRQNEELTNPGTTRWESEEPLVQGDARRRQSDDVDSPDPAEARRWDEEKLRISKRLWEDRQRAKRKMEELSGTADYYDPAEPNDSDPDSPNEPKGLPNDMSRLEEVERAKILPDTCQDDTSTTEYDNTKWTKDRLQSMRQAWEATKHNV